MTGYKLKKGLNFDRDVGLENKTSAQHNKREHISPTEKTFA
jgi:hypothetical protein